MVIMRNLNNNLALTLKTVGMQECSSFVSLLVNWKNKKLSVSMQIFFSKIIKRKPTSCCAAFLQSTQLDETWQIARRVWVAMLEEKL